MPELSTSNLTVSATDLPLAGDRTSRFHIVAWVAAYAVASVLVGGLVWVIPILQEQSAGFTQPAPARELMAARPSLQHGGRQATTVAADQLRIR